MRLSALVTIAVALGFAGLAGYLAMGWLEQQQRDTQPIVVEKKVPSKTIVVAVDRLRYGSKLSKRNLREINWHAEELPKGAFAKIADVLGSDDKRYAISSIEPNEPILKWKVTGPGQRPSLAALLSPGMKAVTIRVNDVNGIAGFVLPGDRVDVMLTRKEDKAAFTEVLLQGVRVLGVDQIADERTDKKALVAKSVTLEVKIEDAQRVILASAIGNLALALRSPATSGMSPTTRMTPAGLIEGAFQLDPSSPAQHQLALSRTVGVVRAVKRTEYSVPSQSRVAEAQPVRMPAPMSEPLRAVQPATVPTQSRPVINRELPVSAIETSSRVN
jgi:pilus assembly protein CpaB